MISLLATLRMLRALQLRAYVWGTICWLTAASSSGWGQDIELLEEAAFQQAVAKVAPAVVRIDVVGGVDWATGNALPASVTTGIIVSETGEIITSAWTFFARPTSITVTLHDGRHFAARRVAVDYQRMVALLKIDAEQLPTVDPANKELCRVGQWALAVGRTFDGEAVNLSVGVISALNRIWGKALQTDAKVSPVNYGGPLINLAGEVMGVLVPLSPQEGNIAAAVEWYDSGIGFAIPLVDVLRQLPRMRQGEDLRPGLMGLSFKAGSLFAKPVIDRVRRRSPAERAGLRVGDQIVKVDGQTTPYLASVRHILGQKYAGETLRLVVQGEDQVERALEITLVDELPSYQPPFLGILTHHAPAQQTQIAWVWPDSPAARAGLIHGDRVVSLDHMPIVSRDDLQRRLSQKSPQDVVQLEVQRDGKRVSVDITLEAYPQTLPPELPVLHSSLVVNETRPLPSGRHLVRLEAHHRDFWIYLPENGHRDQSMGLIMLLLPPGRTIEAAVIQTWKRVCDQRQIILAGIHPGAARGWLAGDLEFLHDALEHLMRQYPVDVSRVVVHGVDESSRLAVVWSQRDRSLIKGTIVAGQPWPAGPMPEASPEHPQAWLFVHATGSAQRVAITQSARQLRQRGFPTLQISADFPEENYLPTNIVEQIALWLDSLSCI